MIPLSQILYLTVSVNLHARAQGKVSCHTNTWFRHAYCPVILNISAIGNIEKILTGGFLKRSEGQEGFLWEGFFLLSFLKANPFTLSPRKAAHQSHHLWMRTTTHSSVHEGRHGVRNSCVLHLLADAAPFKCFRK